MKRDREFLDYVKTKPCLACGSSQDIDPCHVRSVGAGGIDDWWNVIPMCRKHHRLQHDRGWGYLLQKFPRVEKYLFQNGWYWLPNGKIWNDRFNS